MLKLLHLNLTEKCVKLSSEIHFFLIDIKETKSKCGFNKILQKIYRLSFKSFGTDVYVLIYVGRWTDEWTN